MLTEQEKQTILNSMWVVNTVLKELDCSKNKDYKQLAILLLHKCIKLYDASKGVKWTTYAYNFLYLKLKSQKSKDYAKRQMIASENGLHFVSIPFNEERATAVATLTQLKKLLTEQEIFVLEQKQLGYSLTEISKKLNRSHTYTSKLWQSIKDKATPLK